jgi:ACS family hexuronate transporter-like MFS transporter
MKYYQRLTLLFCLMFGFIGIQRVVINVIIPVIKEDLGFTFTQQGMIVAINGLTWAFGTFIFATLGDRYGRRPIIVICTILSGIFSWITGFVHSVGQLLTIRGFLGLVEGGPYPLSMGTISEEAPPERRAMHAGLVTGCFMLIGLGLGSQAAGWLMDGFGSWDGFRSWRPVFYVVSAPAILVGILLMFMMREAPSVAKSIQMRKAGQKNEETKKEDRVTVWDALKYRNVLLSSINSIPVMGWLFVFTAFASSFLVDVHKFDIKSIGFIISAAGVGGFLGQFSWGSISDTIGRKKALILTALLCSAFGIAVTMVPVGTSALVFGTLFFFYGLFGGGMYPMFLSTLPAESVPPRISATAVAIPTAVGEILGSALMPTIAGKLADEINLFAPMWMAALAGIVIAIVSIFYIETAPRCLEKMEHKPTQMDHILKVFR